MCGIWSIVNFKDDSMKMDTLYQNFIQLYHRGPDFTSFQSYHNQLIIGFTRLAIVNRSHHGNQPFVFEDDQRTVMMIANAEIYNYKELADKYKIEDPMIRKNDCHVLAAIYYQMVKTGQEEKFFNFIRDEVKGEFACIFFEFNALHRLYRVVAVRDEIGIRPLYYHPLRDESECLFFTSELKAGRWLEDNLIEFPPGHITTYKISELKQIDVRYELFQTVYNTNIIETWDDEKHIAAVQHAVMNAVRSRLSADAPLAFLLSGGVDSSLVASLASCMLPYPIRTFCCGMRGGTDLIYAQKVADYIKSQHTEVIFTKEEALAAIPSVIRTVETWDTTTIRASVGQYLISEFIGLHTDCRVVMVGEGPDEVCSSYLFNWYAPNAHKLDVVAKQSVRDIHYYDVKRADRCISHWGLEGRVPLLDPEFIRTYWGIPAEKRMPTYKGCEKWWLREAFANTNLLPHEVLFRKKEAFSDGVSNAEESWFHIIQAWVEDKVTDQQMTEKHQRFPYYTPQTKEAYYYRTLFVNEFGDRRQTVIPGYWQPKWSSDGKEVIDYVDPSARILGVYRQ